MTVEFHHLLKKCKNLRQIKQIHGQLTTTGHLHRDTTLHGRLFTISATVDSIDLHYATLLFSNLHHPTTFFFNALIKAHLKELPNSTNPLRFFKQLRLSSVSPDSFTFPLLLQASSSLPQGLSLHGQIIKHGLDSCVYVINSLIHFYSVKGHVNYAKLTFDCSESLDVVSWNTMLSALLRIGDLDYAEKLFDEMPVRNVVSWSALIGGYVQRGMSKQALGVFREMQVANVKPNDVTLVNVLAACAHLGALEQGKWVHGYLKSNGVKLSVFLGSSLIDMYTKCGEVELALEVFNRMRERNLLVWTSMIKGLAMHGWGKEALSLFHDLERAGIVPDDITFIGVLCACTHVGLVEQGRQIFESMTVKYGIRHKIEHYGCMVDLLARNGLLDEAKSVIDTMPMEPDALVWGSLMAGCRFYHNIEIAEKAAKNLMRLEPDNGAVYVLLANIYVASGRQEDAKKLRKLIDERGVTKVAGCSSIEINGTVHEFIAGDNSHLQIQEILFKWEEIEKRLRLEGYIPSTSEVLLDISEEDKESAMARHSEKLAIAFGLLYLVDGVAIRIMKNLRVCNDCHHVTKLISKIYDREIIVRDRIRFHLFKKGGCTCKDYW